MISRSGTLKRVTAETDIEISISLDGEGGFIGSCGIGFFDHMLELFARHGECDIDLKASGDIHVDGHHLIEDIGICLGRSIKEALGNKKGIKRYGHSYVPMDEALVRAVVDLSGRPYLAYKAEGLKDKVGQFDTELVGEFLRAVANSGAITLHLELLYGDNTHHCIEAMFKALARAFKEAWTISLTQNTIPSTKGILE